MVNSKTIKKGQKRTVTSSDSDSPEKKPRPRLVKTLIMVAVALIGVGLVLGLWLNTPDKYSGITTLCGNGWDGFKDVVITGNGNIITVGDSNSRDGDFLGVFEDSELGQVKGIMAVFNSKGSLSYLKSTKAYTYLSLMAAPDGSVLAAGSVSQDAAMTAVLANLDSNGQVLWEQVGLEENNQWNITPMIYQGLAIGPNDSIIAYGTTTDDKTFVAKFSWNGIAESFITLDQGWYVSGVATTSDGGIAIVGRQAKNPETDLISNLIPKVAMFDSQGQSKWVKTFGAGMSDLALAVVATANGIIVSGKTYSASNDFSVTDSTGRAVLIEYDLAGEVKWANTYGGSNGDTAFDDVAVTTAGEIIAVGSTTSTDGDFPIEASEASHIHAIIARLASDGTLNWSKTYGGIGNAMLYGVVPTPTGEIVAAGASTTTEGNLPPSCQGQYAVLIQVPPQ